MSHTPGPWRIDTVNRKRYIFAKGYCVADLGDTGADEDDARLIAAAPELLAAAKRGLETVASESAGLSEDHPLSRDADFIAAAIAKAEGSEIEGLPEGETIASYINSYGDGEADQSALTGGHFEVRE